jgi:hypothetical protein
MKTEMTINAFCLQRKAIENCQLHEKKRVKNTIVFCVKISNDFLKNSGKFKFDFKMSFRKLLHRDLNPEL